jgi:hypothetical protein
MKSHEQAQRVPARLPVLLTEGDHIEHFFTALVGPSGVFVVTRSPSAPGQAVTLTVTLPDGQLFETQGTISQVFGPGDAQEMGVPPGMDVQFAPLGRLARKRWEALIDLARERLGGGAAGARMPLGWESLGGRPATSGPAEAPGRSAAILYHVVPPTIEKLQDLGERVLRPQGIFVRTADVRGAGTPAIVCVVHAISGDEFHLLGEVLATRPDGVWIKFGKLDPRTLDLFRRFIALGIPDDRATYAKPAAGEEAQASARWLDNAVTIVTPSTRDGEAAKEEASIELDDAEIEVCGAPSLSLDVDALQSGINPELELSFEAELLNDGDEPEDER